MILWRRSGITLQPAERPAPADNVASLMRPEWSSASLTSRLSTTPALPLGVTTQVAAAGDATLMNPGKENRLDHHTQQGSDPDEMSEWPASPPSAAYQRTNPP